MWQVRAPTGGLIGLATGNEMFQAPTEGLIGLATGTDAL